MIKHIWFDLEETLVVRSKAYKKIHNELRYATYANVIGTIVSDQLREDYEGLYSQQGSNSAVFTSLGLSSDYWQKSFNSLDKSDLSDPNTDITLTLKALKEFVPLSIFTNLTKDEIVKTLGFVEIPIEWFQFILSGDDVKNRKPAPDGFMKMIELSKVNSSEILYVGDREDVDIKPAKSLGIRTCLVWGNSDIADFSFQDFTSLLDIQIKRVD
ncbi:MAG: HAD family hydrolase [Parcubacteria group bacterium]|nr:HAD family hydrolase [Parcubacteria group bacterium]